MKDAALAVELESKGEAVDADMTVTHGGETERIVFLGIFENEPRDEAATVTDLSGPVENPQADTWQVVGKLVQNAFFKAILPGFERVAS